MPIISDIRKRLIPFFRAKKAIPRPEEKVDNGGVSEGFVEKSKGITGKAIKDESRMPSPTGHSPNDPLETEKSGVLEPASHFETSELILEIKNNSATAKTPWSGKLISFKTDAWDHRSSEEDFLPAGVMEELDEAYVYIRLANKLVWLSEDLGRSSQDIGENYLKICTNISEHLDMAMSLVKVETEQSPKPQQTVVKLKVEGNLGANETGMEEPAAGPVAKAEFDETNKLLVQGIAKLFIAQGTHGMGIAALINILNGTPDIKVLSSGGAVRERSWVILSLDKALPLLQILREIPIVKSASLRGNDIEVTLASG